jgi:hypothetical protein
MAELQLQLLGSTLGASKNASRDYVLKSKLKTIINQSITTHKLCHSQPGLSGLSEERVETWHREHQIGSGGFGRIWLESMKLSDGKKNFRAVKQLDMFGIPQTSKYKPVQYLRELETILRFSQTQARILLETSS